MKTLKIELMVRREDEKDCDESLRDDLMDAIIDVVEDRGLLAFMMAKVVDDEEDE